MKGSLIRTFALILLVCFAALNCFEIGLSVFTDTGVLWRDLDQDYILVNAAVNGLNPYLPISELAAQLDLPRHALGQPSPHPPTLIPWLLPISMLSREMAGVLWFAVSLICLWYACDHILRLFTPVKRPSLPWTLFLFCIFVVLGPTQFELKSGQFSIVLLLLMLMSYERFINDEKFLSGALLGVAFTVKPILWPLLLLLALREEHDALKGAVAIVVPLSALAALMIGTQGMISYVFVAVPESLAVFNASSVSVSLSSLFSSTFASLRTLSPPPAKFLGPLFVLDKAIWLIFLVLMLQRNFPKEVPPKNFFWSMGIASIVLSPIAWSHYAVLAYPAVVVLACKLFLNHKDFSPLWQLALLFPLLLPGLLSLPLWFENFKTMLTFHDLAETVFGSYPLVSPWVAALFKIPAIALAIFAYTFYPSEEERACCND